MSTHLTRELDHLLKLFFTHCNCKKYFQKMMDCKGDVPWFDHDFVQTQTGHFVNQNPAKIFQASAGPELQVVLSVRYLSRQQKLTVTHARIRHNMPALTSDLLPGPMTSEGHGKVTSCQNTSLHPSCCCHGDRRMRPPTAAELTHAIKLKKVLTEMSCFPTTVNWIIVSF